MPSGRPPGGAQRGFTYFGALFVIVLMGAALAGTGLLWSTANRRAKERELLWVGTQYAQALRRYYENSPDPKQYPQRLEELLEDRRRPTVQYHLRRLYPDPLTGTTDWALILASDGRIVGVHSRETREPFKRERFPPQWSDFDGTSSFADWQFVAERAFASSSALPEPGSADVPQPFAFGTEPPAGLGTESPGSAGAESPAAAPRSPLLRRRDR